VFEDSEHGLRNLLLDITCTNTWFFPTAPYPINKPVSSLSTGI
jgi:hypothetical protein